MRDLRDPEKLGVLLMDVRNETGKPLSETYDRMPRLMQNVSDYSHTETLASVTMREYREKQIRLAEAGEVTSRRLCDEKGWAYFDSAEPVSSALDEDSRAHTTIDDEAGEVVVKVDDLGWEPVSGNEDFLQAYLQSSFAPSYTPLTDARCTLQEAHFAHEFSEVNAIGDPDIYWCPGIPE